MGDNPAMAYEYFKDLKGPSVPKLLASTQAISLSLTHTHTLTKYVFLPPR